MNRKEALATLNLNDTAGMDEVKKAYRRLAFELHPDLHPDKPEMARRFQLLNEAYMVLSKPGGLSGESGSKYGSTDADTEKMRSEAQKAYADAKRRFGEGKTFKAPPNPPPNPPKSDAFNTGAAKADTTKKDTSSAFKSKHSWPFGLGAKNRQAQSSAKAGAGAAAQKSGSPFGQGGKKKPNPVAPDPKHKTFQTPEQREAFRRTLKDPFARSVFKEIYSQLREEKGRKHIASRLEKTGVGRVTSGVVGAVKGWFRRQIDDEQEVFMPSGMLRPGQKVRLQVRQGLSGELKTIELVLPADYSPSKPIRLKGLGKKIGSLQGDLYIKIIPQLDNKVEAAR